jgi:hypothetical protein
MKYHFYNYRLKPFYKATSFCTNGLMKGVASLGGQFSCISVLVHLTFDLIGVTLEEDSWIYGYWCLTPHTIYQTMINVRCGLMWYLQLIWSLFRCYFRKPRPFYKAAFHCTRSGLIKEELAYIFRKEISNKLSTWATNHIVSSDNAK